MNMLRLELKHFRTITMLGVNHWHTESNRWGGRCGVGCGLWVHHPRERERTASSGDKQSRGKHTPVAMVGLNIEY